VHVTLNLFTNYLNHFVDTELDLRAAAPLLAGEAGPEPR
jgi:hypothetical protein